MRIIGGRARGLRLEAGPQEAVRPTTDRVKETVFNILGDITGCVVVDFFAGSGSLGLEALSRGAKKVYFIEQDIRTCRVIKKNLQKVERSLGETGNAEVFSCSFSQAYHKIGEKPDLLLADPPYADNCLLASEFLENTNIAQWAGSECILALEHTADFAMPQDSLWKNFRRKNFGQTAFTFWEQISNV